jgi:LuxR family maltose regulon positive regulatory protein
MARTAGDSHMAVMILCDLATVRIDRGRLRKAVAAVERALQLADRYAGRGGQLPPSSGHTHTYLARVLLEWNDLAGALRHARQGNDLCKLWGQPETLATSYYSLARVLQAMGDTDGALDAMQAAGQLAAGLSPWIAARVSAWEAIIRLAGGDLRAADRWRRQSGLCADDQPGFQQRFLYRALARVLVALGREQPEASYLDQATGLLSTLLEAAEAAGALGYCIEILVLQTMAFQGQGKTDLALDALARALDLAEPEGYVRTFIDEGEPMGTLLRQTAARGITPDYVGKLLAASEREEGVERRTAALIESLSARELEVLRLLATHLSSTEMAQELYISANTVRSHIKNIYGKLNVHSRRDAVERARELGLL